MAFVVARTAGGRPSLMHETTDLDVTTCGLDISKWSRAYRAHPIKEILCRKCSTKGGKK
jgi:hypothetical protein